MTHALLKRALEALENSIDLVQHEYTANWRHGVPTRAAQLAALKADLDVHEAAITDIRAELSKSAPQLPSDLREYVDEAALEGVQLVCHVQYDPGEPQTRWHPGCPSSALLAACYLHGTDLLPIMSSDQIADIEARAHNALDECAADIESEARSRGCDEL
jgi:hypothetical protein